MTAASLDNTGVIEVNSLRANQALLDVTGSAGFGATGVLSGAVAIGHRTSPSGTFFSSIGGAIEFASGQITTIAASSQLTLDGPNAFIEDSTALGSNSALTGLANVKGELDLYDGASVSTGALTNSGVISLGSSRTSALGSSLSIAGVLTNTGRLSLFFGTNAKSGFSVTASSFVNSGEVDLTVGPGVGGPLATLNVSGTTTNNGVISIAVANGSYDTEELAGAVSGTGSFSLSNADLAFDSSVSSGQTITETGTDVLTLKQAQSFAATISGFGTGDTIDATNFHAPPATTYNFVENIAGTGGTLTLTDTSLSLTAKISMTGHYTNADFTLAPDSGTGTLVKFV